MRSQTLCFATRARVVALGSTSSLLPGVRDVWTCLGISCSGVWSGGGPFVSHLALETIVAQDCTADLQLALAARVAQRGQL